MNRTDHDPGKKEAAAERRNKAFELRKQGVGYRAIGAALGISEAQAHRDVQAALKRLATLEMASAEEYRTLELARLDTLTVAAARCARGATGDATRLAAIDRLLRISESRRKLLGLDAPAKTALTNPDGTPAAYAELRTVVLNLLAPYPDLRLALADQLAQVDEVTDGELADD